MFKHYLKIIWNILLILFIVFCLLFHQLIIYGIAQGKGQLSIVLNSEPIETLLEKKELSDSIKQKLTLIQEIKRFAIDSLGINETKNYSSFYDQTNKPKLITISACEPFSFKAKEWYFPFLGSVSYKGYFNKNKARKEIISLKINNYDVDVYNPSGWSTLGWFNDPVLSSMLKRNEGQLANLIIHELTHGTLYIKNNVTFNENLANFIGDKGAERFLIYKYGAKSKEFKTYENNKSDEKTYNNYILESKTKLDSLYKSFGKDEAIEIKREKKNNLIRTIVLGVNKLNLSNSKNYFNFTLQAFYEGNAFFMAFDRYDSQYDVFENEYTQTYNSDLKKYLNSLKKNYSN